MINTLVVILVVGAPFLFAVALQMLGERRGWSGRLIVRRSFITMWLWYSLAWGFGARMDPLGFAVIGAIVGAVVFASYVVITWAFRGINENYERYLAKKRMMQK